MRVCVRRKRLGEVWGGPCCACESEADASIDCVCIARPRPRRMIATDTSPPGPPPVFDVVSLLCSCASVCARACMIVRGWRPSQKGLMKSIWSTLQKTAPPTFPHTSSSHTHALLVQNKTLHIFTECSVTFLCPTVLQLKAKHTCSTMRGLSSHITHI